MTEDTGPPLVPGDTSSSKEVAVGDIEQEPNGIPIQMAAAAPGDFFARFALKSKDLEATYEFYTAVMGMEICGLANKDLLCLRYNNDRFQHGIPTTLVFEREEEHKELVAGDCFDHLAIQTEESIQGIYEHVSS